MKIVTVNIPESYIDAIAKLVGEDGLYPSRSELIRVAVREFLIRELQIAKNILNIDNPNDKDDYDKEKFVRVPIADSNPNNRNAQIQEFKTYKIIKRLEF